MIVSDPEAQITIDNTSFEIRNLLSLMVVKQPYYGFGMKVVPKAKFDDRQMHILSINSGLFKYLMGVASSFTIGNRIGKYCTGQKLNMKLDRSLPLQIDGNAEWDASEFRFTILPKALKIKC